MSQQDKSRAAQRRGVPKVLLSAEDLREFGVSYSRVQLWKMVRDGLFPPPIKISTNRNAWVASEVTAWLEARMNERAA